MAVTGLSPTIHKQLTAVKDNPQDADAWQTLGNLLAEGGDARRAGDWILHRSLLADHPAQRSDFDTRLSAGYLGHR
jgi:hypothetical protein